MMLFFILLIAFLLRLISLTQSLWLDEATTARVVSEYNVIDILSKFSIFDFHPPLYYFFMKFWTTIFGYSEISLRMPSILFSLLTGFVIYKIGMTFYTKRAALWSTIFFLFNPLIIYYSQEARMYMMATFLLSASLYYFLLLIKFNQKVEGGKIQNSKFKYQINNLKFKIIIFNVITFLSFLTFYGTIFLIGSFYIYLLFKRKFQLLGLLLPGILLAFIVISPLLYRQLVHAHESLSIVANWKLVLGSANLKNFMLIPIKFSFGRISFEPKSFYYLLAGSWTIIVMTGVIVGGLKNRVILYLFALPVVLGILFSFFTPLLQYFRFLYLIPLMSLLLALGIEQIKNKTIQSICNLTITTGFIILSCVYLLNPQFHREDWKQVAYTLHNYDHIYAILPSMDAFRYYNHQTRVLELRNIEKVMDKSDLLMKNEIVIIPYTASIYGFDYSTLLKKYSYTQALVQNYRGVSLEVWKP